MAAERSGIVPTHIVLTPHGSEEGTVFEVSRLVRELPPEADGEIRQLAYELSTKKGPSDASDPAGDWCRAQRLVAIQQAMRANNGSE